MHKGSKGETVRAFQLALIAAGYTLPRWGADGQYGDETDDAAEMFAAREGVPKRDGEVDDDLIQRLAAATSITPPQMPASIVDTRDAHSGHKRLRRRGWSQIRRITLHQTATCYLYPNSGDLIVRRAVARVSEIGVHGVVMRPGFSVLSNDPTWEMPQAQAFNPDGLGIEIDGFFAGVEGDPFTFWQPPGVTREPMRESPAQTAAAAELIGYLVALVASHGGRIRYLNAHRQTSATRRSDPGELLWRTIAVPAMARHGLTFGGDGFHVKKSQLDANGRQLVSGLVSSAGPGRPIPRQWDPSATAEY